MLWSPFCFVLFRLFIEVAVVATIFDSSFSKSSFGFRKKRFADGEALQVKQHIRASYRECVDMDLSKYFDRRPMLRIVARI